MRFFPDFALRDVMLWLGCLLLLCALAAFLPYGPNIPGMEWDLGNKADPLAPAYPGIKPEWYFLWVYQLLKEFPPHLLGLEGPQICLFVVSILMGIWAVVPWLDVKARRGEESPEFTDLGVAAILFLSFLTLKAWDVGAAHGASDPASLIIIARTASYWVLGLFAVITAMRALLWHDRWFVLSTAAAVQAALHGLFGVPYLESAAIVGVITAALVVLLVKRAGASAKAVR